MVVNVGTRLQWQNSTCGGEWKENYKLDTSRKYCRKLIIIAHKCGNET